ncbi:hypothetical protein FM123_03255 [Limosilactobacillus fermentum]|nr:hypothetical protein FM122_03935 [Limosilactobacillus fermentum]SJM51668.1 hypothetical protein FM123_03255 [Limosilactobacillus fermentum]
MAEDLTVSPGPGTCRCRLFERGEFPTPAEIRALKAAFARLLN